MDETSIFLRGWMIVKPFFTEHGGFGEKQEACGWFIRRVVRNDSRARFTSYDYSLVSDCTTGKGVEKLELDDVFRTSDFQVGRGDCRPVTYDGPLARRARISTRHLLTGLRRRAEGPSYVAY